MSKIRTCEHCGELITEQEYDTVMACKPCHKAFQDLHDKHRLNLRADRELLEKELRERSLKRCPYCDGIGEKP